MDDVEILEDSICDDDEPKDVDYEDWIDLCENINILQTNFFFCLFIFLKKLLNFE